MSNAENVTDDTKMSLIGKIDELRAQKLADEIVEAQKQRGGYLKWKLVLVAALGAAALGLGDEDGHERLILLALVPFVCVYVDLLCYGNNLRILVIGKYFEAEGCRYEKHAGSCRTVFGMEDWALYCSSYFAATVVLVLGAIWLATRNVKQIGVLQPTMLIIAGVGGLLLVGAAQFSYAKKKGCIGRQC
jgi:hypothetical protein